jgi:methyl-accepting chemotaxis protein
MDAVTNNGVTIRDQMAADQVHDALRADVLAALLAGADGSAGSATPPGATAPSMSRCSAS